MLATPVRLFLCLLVATLAVAPSASAVSSGLPALPGSELEPNNTRAQATEITSGSRVRATLLGTNDEDYYKFTARAGDRVYTSAMTAGSATGSSDGQLTLLDSDGTTVIEFDEDNGTFAALSPSIAGARIEADGTYYLKYRDYGTGKQGYYDLYLTLQSGTPPAEVEPNDTSGSAQSLSLATDKAYVSGARNPSGVGEQDWYALQLNAGDTVFLSLDLDPERDGTNWNGRLGFGLFGDSSNQVTVVDDGGTGDVNPVPNLPSEAMMMTVRQGGTYYGFVDSASGGVGGPSATYALSIQVIRAAEVAAGETCTTYSSSDVPKAIGPSPGLVSSTMNVPTGAALITRAALRLDLQHAVMADLDVHLRSPAGNNIGVFSDIGSASMGGQQQMDTMFDQYAASPPSFTTLKGLALQPESAYRLSWLEGELAAGTWTLDIDDDLASNSGTLNGWNLIICTRPSESPGRTLLEADFESGDNGFTHSGSADEWERGTPSTAATFTTNPLAAFTTCRSGTKCWKTDLDGAYETNSNQDLISPAISMPSNPGTPVIASWWSRYQLEGAQFDSASVTVNEVGNTSNSAVLWQWTDGNMTDSAGGTPTLIGASAGWGKKTATIPASFAGKTVELRFNLSGDSAVVFSGLAIDDVRVAALTSTLSASVNGDGSGYLTSSPAGIDCGSGGRVACLSTLDRGTQVTLAPTADSGSEFTGWSGACSGTGGCTVTLNQVSAVVATFSKAAPPSGPPATTTQTTTTAVTTTPTKTTPTAKCISSRTITLRLKAPKGTSLKKDTGKITVFGKTLKMKRDGKGFKYVLSLKGKEKRTVKVKLVATSSKGKRVTRTQTFKTCAKKTTATKK